MNHTREHLADYVLGLLSPQEMEEVERHLENHPEARRTVKELQEALFSMTDDLEPLAVNPDSWQKIQARLEPPQVPAEPAPSPTLPPVQQTSSGQTFRLPVFLTWAAVVAVVTFGGWYGLGVYQNNQQTRLIESWVEDAREVKPLLQQQTQVASVAFRDQNRALVIMNAKAADQKSYQVWGIKAGQPVSLGVIASRTFEVNTEGYEAIAVSLEPYGGSETPTEVLGAVSVG